MGSHRTAPSSTGGFLDSIISAVSDFASSVISIPRRTVETVETLLFEPGSPGEAVGEVVDIFNPVQIARDLETIAAPITETRINPDTGRPETVEVEPSILLRVVNGVGDFIRGAGEAAAAILPAPSTIIIVLGIVAVIVVAVAVTAATT